MNTKPKSVKDMTKAERKQIREGIKSWVKQGRVSSDIVNTPLNTKTYKGMRKAIEKEYGKNNVSSMLQNSDYVNEIYDRFDIVRYKTKQDFELKMIGYVTDGVITKQQMEVMWQDYLKRDKLIITGQYERQRYEILKNNYVKAMEGKGHSPELVKIVKEINNIDKMRKLFALPNAKKDSADKTLMPAIGNYDYKNLGVMDNKHLYEEQAAIEEALNRVGIVTNLTTEMLKKLTPKKRWYIETEESTLEDERNYYEEEVRRRFANKIMISKDGHKYIRGLGSTVGGNRASLVSRIIDLVEAK